MKRIFVLLAVLFLITNDGFSQDFFKKEKLIETGVYYYPEAWDSSQWDRDFQNMVKMGFEFTHFTDFAWAILEPSEGQYNFEWLDKAIELAAKHGLKVILCTPTAAPPVWLTKKYPEVLVVRENGQRAMHGTREHYSWSSKKYRELTEKIVTEMAKRYGNDKRVWGWQIDNEPSHYGTVDYGPEVALNFKDWLKRKYSTIEALNTAWGTVFWSGVYSDFDQIELPNKSLHTSGTGNPHSVLDFKRFSADECASYVSFQYKILKSIIQKDQFVTTNFMSSHEPVDPWRNADLDFVSYTMYPAAGYQKGVGNQGFRIGNIGQISFANDFYRSIKGKTGVMELQPGQVNWGRYNPQPYPGAVRAWLWNSFAGDLSFICSYRYRQPLFGGEHYHYGMVGTDGVTPSRGGLEFSRFISEIKVLRKHYNSSAIVPTEYANRKTAILYHKDNEWNTNELKQTFQWSYGSHLEKYYKALISLTIPVDFVSEERDFSKYKVLLLPAYQLVDNALILKLTNYVKEGGNLILTVRTGTKDRNGKLFEDKWGAKISPLIGAKIKMFDVLSDDINAEVIMNNVKYHWNNWADILENDSNTEVWASYNDQFYKGAAAVTNRKLEKGSVTYIGVDSDDGRIEKEVIDRLYNSIGLTTEALPEGVVKVWRSGFWIVINYNTNPVEIEIPANATIIIGENSTLQPAGVLVWQD
ncbi:MAG: beta-galactosidase [Sedimentisphaerales bacterium]|nr:beta-galactosidase [Sedimentisphaerales bacterium]